MTSLCDPISLIQLARCRGMGAVRFKKILAEFGGAKEALQALLSSETVREAYGIVKISSSFEAEMEKEALERLGGRFIFSGEGSLLAHLEYPPPLLSALGDVTLLTKGPLLSLVGSRSPTAAGLKMASYLSSDLSEQNFVIVSGLAQGIDAHVHRHALKGGTIAVIANGVDVCYPKANASLQHSIAESGLLLSEYPLRAMPDRRLFPRRNRIISGLSLGTVVIEAHEASGSLITARFAKEQGKHVWAVPGSPLDPLARGPNQLLREGATLVQNASHILETLGMDSVPSPRRRAAPSRKNETLCQFLNCTVPQGVEELAALTHAPVAQVRTALMELGLEGKVVQQATGFVLNQEAGV